MNLCAYKIYNKNRSSKFKEEWKSEEEAAGEGVFIGEPRIRAENVNYHRDFDLLAFIGITVLFDT